MTGQNCQACTLHPKSWKRISRAVRLRWSNGPVEGQISRLKMLKRQMYGRANLELLKRGTRKKRGLRRH